MSRECCGFQGISLSCQQDCSVPSCICGVVGQQGFSLPKTAVGSNTICMLTTSIPEGEERQREG